jgi:GDP-4-dehydro-6-deoxy-D-mannose reductase
VQLLKKGETGGVYNVASGVPVSLAQVFERLAGVIEVSVQPVTDPALLRPNDIPHLVGDAAKLRARTGWTPRHTLDQALAEVVGAQAD